MTKRTRLDDIIIKKRITIELQTKIPSVFNNLKDTLKNHIQKEFILPVKIIKIEDVE
jgi:uncharacterized alkaline shock family protein YloU